MRYLPAALPLVIFLLTGLCHSQEMQDDDPLPYRFSIGAGGGLALQLRNPSPAMDDPLHVPDSGLMHGMASILMSYLITPSVAIEFATNHIIRADENQLPTVNEPGPMQMRQDFVESLYPNYFLLSDDLIEPSYGTAGIGLGYRLQLGSFSVAASLLACYAEIAPGVYNFRLKKQGANEYRTITHRTERNEGFTMVPALTLRYSFLEDGSQFGLLMRASYVRITLDMLHTITDGNITDAPTSRLFTTSNTFETLNVGVGVYYDLF